MAVMPPPTTTTRRPTGSVAEILRLAELGDVVDGVVDAGAASPRHAERVDAGEAEAEEHRVEVAAQLGEREVAAERLAGLDRDAADRQDEIDLALGEVVDRLVGGDAVFVEAADLLAAPRR